MLKRLSGIVLLVGLSLVAIGDDLNQPVPVQSFEQAGAPTTNTATPPAAAPAKVHSTPAPVVTAPAPATSPSNDEVDAISAAQPPAAPPTLTQLNQNQLQFEQKTDTRIITLATQLQALTTRVTQLEQNLTLANQQIVTLTSQKAMGNGAGMGAANAVTQWLSPMSLKLLIVGGVCIILLLVWALWPKNPLKKSLPLDDTAADDENSEYDYMGSRESVPAKLNLARAYIAMEEYTNAIEALKEVQKDGTPEQQATATELLAKIPVNKPNE